MSICYKKSNFTYRILLDKQYFTGKNIITITGRICLDKTLDRLNRLNPDMGIHSVEVSEFQSYGRILRDYDTGPALSLLEPLIPGEGVTVITRMEDSGTSEKVLGPLVNEVFGGFGGLQLGAVYGRNLCLNALEYHKCAEVMVAASPMILLAGLVCEIEWPRGIFDLSKIQAFYISAGTALEIHPWCLRCHPVHVFREEGFKCLTVLTMGTNEPMDPLSEQEGEAKLMTARNRWVLAHQDGPEDFGADVHCGLVGRNIEMQTLR